VRPNLELLQNAVRQVGPWAGSDVEVTPGWYIEALREVIARLDWAETADDVRRFLSPDGRESLVLWSVDMFDYHLKQLAHRIEGSASKP
jgi:hypothetical protein